MKVEIGLAKGKKLYDKRQDIAKRSAEKEIAIRLKENKNKYSLVVKQIIPNEKFDIVTTNKKY